MGVENVGQKREKDEDEEKEVVGRAGAAAATCRFGSTSGAFFFNSFLLFSAGSSGKSSQLSPAQPSSAQPAMHPFKNWPLL